MSFASLPFEIQLIVLSQAEIPMHIPQIAHLQEYITSRKLAHYLQAPLSLSLFCPSAKTSNHKLYYAVHTREVGGVVELELGELEKTEEIIPLSSKDQVMGESSDNHLDLLIDEEQSSIRVHVQLRLDHKIISETPLLVSTAPCQKLIKNEMAFDLKLEKGEAEDRGGYGFTDLMNYSLNIQSLKINNEDFLRKVEKEMGQLIVRY